MAAAEEEAAPGCGGTGGCPPAEGFRDAKAEGEAAPPAEEAVRDSICSRWRSAAMPREERGGRAPPAEGPAGSGGAGLPLLPGAKRMFGSGNTGLLAGGKGPRARGNLISI